MHDFTIPSTLAPGKYRARLKIDWNNINPGGRVNYESDGNKIDENGGAVLDFMLNVVEDEADEIDEINAIETESEVYDLLGRKVERPAKGNILIVNGKTTKL